MKRIIGVYGTLKKGYGNHRVLGNSKLLGHCKTEPEFTMYSMGGYPGISKGGTTSITLEIYEVDEDTMRSVNRLEGYSGVVDHPSNWYDMTFVNTPFGEAGIFYFKDMPNNHGLIESGSW